MHFQDKSSQGFYQLTFTLQDEGQNYAAKAIPVRAQALQDKACGTLVLMTDGRRTYEGEDAKAECW
jgi:Tfp pilus assembly protein PilE